ncbi:MAG: DUF2384 domain-containing protein [Hormoscilla sp. GUM202]|nr:DUF2384 domain-containing protein [Hormoscilla sp. GUM202]
MPDPAVSQLDRKQNEKRPETDDVSESIAQLNLTNGILLRLQNLLLRLSEEFDGSNEYLRIWLSSPHPALGGDTPLLYLSTGKLEALEEIVEIIEKGQPI